MHGSSLSVPRNAELLYNLTADVEKRRRSQPTRVLFALNGELIGAVSETVHLSIKREICQPYVAYVKVSSSCRP